MAAGRVGAFMLETLSAGLYADHRDAIREYVQNSSDAIRRAETEGLLGTGEGCITVELSPRDRSIVITDSGVGIGSREAEDQLLSIGLSQKEWATDAGFRGIGRLAGLAHCETLRFETTASGDGTGTTVEVDCSQVRGACQPERARILELGELLEDATTVSHWKSKPQEHFFRVALEGVNSSLVNLQDWVSLEGYLGQSAPVDFDPNRFPFGAAIKTWAKHHGVGIPTTRLELKCMGVSREVFKPYGTHYVTHRNAYPVELRGVRFWPADPPDRPDVWAWYGESGLAGMLRGTAAGLRLRHRNIRVGGPEVVAEIFAENGPTAGRFNSYYVGEVHVTGRDVVPNTRRDGFENVGTWTGLREEIAGFAATLCAEAQRASRVCNQPIEKVTGRATKLIASVRSILESGFLTAKERRAILRCVDRERDRVSSAMQRHPDRKALFGKLSLELGILRESLGSEAQHLASSLGHSLGECEANAVIKVLALVEQAVGRETYLRLVDAVVREFACSEGRHG